MEKNSLWKNIRNKAKENKRTGATPKKPTAEMLKQESKIKANSKMMGGVIGGLKGGPTFKVNSGLGGLAVAGGLALAASKLFNNDPSPECLPVKVPVPDNVILAFAAIVLVPSNFKYLDVNNVPASVIVPNVDILPSAFIVNVFVEPE